MNAPAMHLYITHALYFEIYTSPLEGIQLICPSQDMKRSFVGAHASSCIKHHVQPYGIWLTWDARSHPMCVYTERKFYLIIIHKI